MLSSYDTGANSWLTDTDYFNMSTNGIQLWTVPETGTYRITAKGAPNNGDLNRFAGGGGYSGGGSSNTLQSVAQSNAGGGGGGSYNSGSNTTALSGSDGNYKTGSVTIELL